MHTPDTEKRPTYKEVKEEIKKTDYFKSLDEDGNPPDTESHTTPCEGCEEETYDGTSTTYKHTCKDKNTPDTECRCTKFNKDIIDTSECELHQGNVNTPDTKWEKLVKLNRTCGCTLGWCTECLKWKGVLELATSSRDTYWKERVLAILEDVLDREYQKRNPPKKHNYLESFMWDIHKAFMKDITNEDNLK